MGGPASSAYSAPASVETCTYPRQTSSSHTSSNEESFDCGAGIMVVWDGTTSTVAEELDMVRSTLAELFETVKDAIREAHETVGPGPR